MTKKHFLAAVEILKDRRKLGADEREQQLIASCFLDLFKQFNDKFDKHKFMEACGLVRN